MRRHRAFTALKGLALAGALGAGAVLVVSGWSGTRPAASTSRPAGVPLLARAAADRPRPGLLLGTRRYDPRRVALGRYGAGAPQRVPAMRVVAPEAVSIPRLAVTAPVVERVGVLQSGPEAGLLSAPADYHDLGWYVHGTAGVLVVDGHVGFGSGPGPLAYIGMLADGDAVIVRYPHRTLTYHVTAVVALGKGHLPAAYFTARYDGDLMLITCDYQSTFADGHFADNVFAIAAP